jgi:cytochrome c2
VQTVDHVEVDFAALSSDQAPNQDIAWTQALIQARKLRLRLDYNSLPTALIKPERHIVGNRMACPNIDIRSSRLSREG